MTEIMEFIDTTVESADLQLTKDGFMRIYLGFRSEGLSSHRSFNRVALICKKRGIKNYYSSWRSAMSCEYPSKKSKYRLHRNVIEQKHGSPSP